jgi:hypothetical protein
MQIHSDIPQRDNSMLTFESASVAGTAGIVEKLSVRSIPSCTHLCLLTFSQSLPFEKVKHAVSTLDAQPSGETGGILILVTGALLVRSSALLTHGWGIISYQASLTDIIFFLGR